MATKKVSPAVKAKSTPARVPAAKKPAPVAVAPIRTTEFPEFVGVRCNAAQKAAFNTAGGPIWLRKVLNERIKKAG